MSQKNTKSRIDFKTADVKFKDDDYETSKEILTDLLPFIKEHNVIYDPFYCNGYVIKEWETLGKTCLNEKKDAFNREHPENFDIMISNIPFSLKRQSVELGVQLGKPFMLLMPIDTLGSKWIKKYFDIFQFIIPNGRYNFYKKSSTKKSSSWFDTMWVCYKIGLKKQIIKI